MTQGERRDRLRELLDAVLDEDHQTLGEMADGAYVSPYHFSRLLTRHAGEPPVAMRRRVMLERAAWQLRRGAPVTETAWAAGYESLEGFSRAFARAYGVPPSQVDDQPAGRTAASGPDRPPADWLPAPNGIHFHPPTSLWVHEQEQAMIPLIEQLIRHDLDDTRELLDLAKQVSEADYRAERRPGLTVLGFDGIEPSLAAILDHQVFTKQVWVAAIEGEDFPDRGDDDPQALLDRHEQIAPRWWAVVRDIDRRGAWGDRIVDALCDPPVSFVLSGVVSHVVTFAAHRRQRARQLLREAGLELDHGDPMHWRREPLEGTSA